MARLQVWHPEQASALKILFNVRQFMLPSGAMEQAIVLVNLSPGAEERSISALRGMAGIKSVYQVYGLYDLLVVVEGKDDQEVKATIADRLRSNEGVVSTITMKVLH